MKARVITTWKCPRACPGCCNNDFINTEIPAIQKFSGFSEIFLTGGEPLMYQRELGKLLERIRKEQDSRSKVFVYTAAINQPIALFGLAFAVDGITLTLHDPEDGEKFDAFYNMYGKALDILAKHDATSLRLNIFKGVKVKNTGKWIVKDNKVWLPNCPVPEGETLYVLPRLWE